MRNYTRSIWEAIVLFVLFSILVSITIVLVAVAMSAIIHVLTTTWPSQVLFGNGAN